jgi:hypothetical protein
VVCLVQEELHPLLRGWNLEKHSSHMLVKEQPAIQAREDLVSTRGQVKFHVEHMSAKFGSIVHLCHSIIEHLEIYKALVLTLGNP